MRSSEDLKAMITVLEELTPKKDINEMDEQERLLHARYYQQAETLRMALDPKAPVLVDDGSDSDVCHALRWIVSLPSNMDDLLN
ncbi:hypothetical protein KKI24_02875 [bacterium]|nr:hypothetical protein [bacterium]